MGDIRRVAVIGSGVMGAGIAAQVANAGVPVRLYDMTQDMAAAAIAKLLKTEPAPLMSPDNVRHISAHGIDGELAALGDCDWIVEAVVERLDVKQTLFAKIADYAGPAAIISSNTSTIRLAELLAKSAPAFRQRFVITHFFNPPRYMRLLEIVQGESSADVAQSISRFADVALGKSIVWCKDRPGFIANRLGCFWSQAAMATAFDMGVTVEEADVVMGKAFGIPKTGVFGLMDLVGIDLVPHVNASLARALPADDLFQQVNVPLPFMERMIAAGLTGRKGKGGFYRINREMGRRKEVIDLVTGDYRPLNPVTIDGTTPLLQQDTRLGRYARRVWGLVFAYAGLLLGDAADDIAAIDAAMRLGYNWQWGPFELMDRAGDVTQLLKAEGLPIAPVFRGANFYRDGAALALDGNYHPVARAEGLLLLADVKRKSAAVLSNGAAALWDIGDGVCCFEITTKMNTFDAAVFDLLGQALDLATRRFRAMVIGGDGPHTSAGVNLKAVAALIKSESWDDIENTVASGQAALKRLKYCAVPVIGCAHGLALGGGCELLLHCAAIQAHGEANIGLVECGVGLIPGWGGNGELLLRAPVSGKGPMPPVIAAFETIAMAQVSRSAQGARAMGFLRWSDGITMNRDRLLADAKASALRLAENFHPPQPPLFSLPGPSGAVALALQAESLRKLGKASDHDLVVAAALARTLTGGEADAVKPVTEQQLLDIERASFMTLVRRPETLARIEHTLETGKPLRN